MKKELINLFIFVAICFVVYFLFRNFNYSLKEGMTDASSSTSSGTSGIAGSAASYAAGIKAITIKLQDSLLISKYRSDYETTILNLDDLIDNLMLKETLSIDPNKPGETLGKLSQMNQAKLALNNVMKFIDSSK
jgi:hypothetical protein